MVTKFLLSIFILNTWFCLEYSSNLEAAYRRPYRKKPYLGAYQDKEKRMQRWNRASSRGFRKNFEENFYRIASSGLRERLDALEKTSPDGKIKIALVIVFAFENDFAVTSDSYRRSEEEFSARELKAEELAQLSRAKDLKSKAYQFEWLAKIQGLRSRFSDSRNLWLGLPTEEIKDPVPCSQSIQSLGPTL